MEKPKRILVVDDEPANRELLDALLELLGHQAVTAGNGDQALARMDDTIDLVLLDVMMPGMDGFEVARRIRALPDVGDIPICMVTALNSRKDRLDAVEAGANDFIAKPIDRTELNVRTASLLKVKEARDASRRYQADLEQKVQERTRDLQQALVEVRNANLDTIQRLAVASEYKDRDTALHIHRMSRFCALLAEGMGLPADEVEVVLHASPMHDVGKIGIPDGVLLKPDRLNDVEWQIMKEHTRIGARILSGSASPLLAAGEVIALSHHEKWNGSGYPNGLAGEAIPLYGRICAVADVFDALTSRRPYKVAFSNDTAYEMMTRERGSHFDPRILDLMVEKRATVEAIQAEMRGTPDDDELGRC